MAVVVVDGVIQLDIPEFRLMFSLLSDEVEYPDAQITMYWNMSKAYMQHTLITFVDLDNQFTMLNLLTAHLVAFNNILVNGSTDVADGGMGFGNSYIVQSASEDNVSIAAVPPPSDSYYEWFMTQTGYGKQYYAALQAQSVALPMIGGSNTLLAMNGYSGTW